MIEGDSVMKYLGIDIGTTTICGAVLSSDGGFVESLTEPNRAFLDSPCNWARMQDPEIILATLFELTDRLIEKHPDIAAIGLSGQMHGILYVDDTGRHVSPLYTWQDARGEQPYTTNESYASLACRLTGHRMASGYGMVTHFYNSNNRFVPAEAVTLCTIADYAVMWLCRLSRPLLHTSNAASLGCFDLKKRGFDIDAANKLSAKPTFLPSVTSDAVCAGTYRGIPVCIAIGDNQASFIGSGADGESILVNVGTGSQISLVSDYTDLAGSVELRPFIGERYLLVGSSLSGGRAYALLERFFRAVVGMTGIPTDSMYPFMSKALERYQGSASLSVTTHFDGNRDEPSARGSITNIGIDNFTPEELMLGFLNGISDELYGMYLKMGSPSKTKLIGSGNGIRKNGALVHAFEQRFGKTLALAQYEEEAACGAALFGRMMSQS